MSAQDAEAAHAALVEEVERLGRACIDKIEERDAARDYLQEIAVALGRPRTDAANPPYLTQAAARLVERVRELEDADKASGAIARGFEQVLKEARAQVAALRKERDAAKESGRFEATQEAAVVFADLRNDRDRARQEAREAREEAERLSGQVETQQDAYEALREELSETIDRMHEAEGGEAASEDDAQRLAATVEALADALEPVLKRYRTMLENEECDCTFDGGGHTCAIDTVRHELRILDAALARAGRGAR